MKALATWFVAFALLVPGFASAKIYNVPVPFLTGPVVDEAQLLSAGDRGELQELIEKLNDGDAIQMAILIPQTLHDYDIETYGIAVAENWKLGKKKDDKGLILIVAPNERRMRFEVGYGLEGTLTDSVTRHILDQVMAPYFKEGRYRDGLMMAVEAVAGALNIDLTAPVSKRLSPKATHRAEFIPLILALVIFFLFFLLSRLAPRSRRYYRGGWWDDGGWGGGGFGGGGFGGGSSGGGFSGGGGGFGGGGSSSSW